MIGAKIKINHIYRNEGSDTCVKAKVITSDKRLKIHEKYCTVSIYGNFPDFVDQHKKYIVTLSDYPSDKGHYRLIQHGRLPRQETLEDLMLLVMENPNIKWSSSEYKELIDEIDNLTKKEEELIIKCLEKDKNFEPTEDEFEIIDNLEDLIKELSPIFNKCKRIVNFRNELVNSLGIEDENIHYTIIKNIKGEFKKTLKALKTNPYLLIDMAELKLKDVDEIALAIGTRADDDNRIAAITEMNLREHGEQGKTWLYKEDYINHCDEIYPYSTSNYEFSKKYLSEKIDTLGDRTGFYINVDESRIASSRYYLLEQELFQIIRNLSTGVCTQIPINKIKTAIKNCEKKNKIKLLDEQKTAVFNSFKNDVSVIAGAAGTGKTTIAKAVSNAYADTIVTALSGKATLRISETTGIEGDRSRTMHSFAGSDNKYIDADLIIIDEASMIGLDIAIDFFKKVRPGTHILILGDHCQLSPIGAGNMFYDLIHSDFMNVNIIKEVHRQALDSNIIRFATDVRQQIYNIEDYKKNTYDDFELYLLNDNKEIAKKSLETFCENINNYDIKDIMLVSPTKRVTHVLNNAIQGVLTKQGLVGDEVIELKTPWDFNLNFSLREGDRVINIENFHNCPTDKERETIAVMNGSLGTFIGKKEIKNKEGKIIKTVYEFEFDGIGRAWYPKNELKRILLGYAITVHKSQGSQADLLIYVHPERCHDRLNCSEMVYTAVTRAKKKAIVISIDSVLERAIVTKELNSKQTLLKEFLDENKPFEETKIKEIDSKTRERYDKNNAQKRAKRRDKNGLLEKEKAKLDKINLIKKLYNEGKTQKEIVEITGFAKGTVSKYLKIG